MEYLFGAADVLSLAQDETGPELGAAFTAADSALGAREPSFSLVDVDPQAHLR